MERTWDLQGKRRGKTPSAEKISDLLDELIEAYSSAGEEAAWEQERQRVLESICTVVDEARLSVTTRPPTGYQTVEDAFKRTPIKTKRRF